jgi:hypothetical protein
VTEFLACIGLITVMYIAGAVACALWSKFEDWLDTHEGEP